MTQSVLDQLVTLSREVGKPEHDLAILGEGNTSALLADGKFLVKASGFMLGEIAAGGFVTMDRAATEAILEQDLRNDEEITAAMMGACASGETRRPSVEAMMHAFLLGLPDVNFIAHTHPVSVNAVLCSTQARSLTQLCLFPDQIVCCGPSPVYVPYTDPGLPLAREVRLRVREWTENNGMTPKAILIQNHGLFALGKTPRDVISCTLMWSKTARIMLGAMACGGIHPLSPQQVSRIYSRPDEKYREKIIAGE